MIEVERKYAVLAGARTTLSTQVASLPAARLSDESTTIDVYYDTADFTCLQQAVFLRVRNQSYLEIKYHEQADPLHLHSTERVFPFVAEPAQMQELHHLCSRFVPAWRQADDVGGALSANNLVAFVQIVKQRTRYVYENLTLCLDHVEGLGDFFEVEACCTEREQVAEADAELQRFVEALACPGLQPVSVGYVELWLRAYLPQVYRLGRYQCEEDLLVQK